MPEKLVDPPLKKEDVSLGGLIRIKKDPIPIYGEIVSVDEFLAHVGSKLYNSENVRKKDKEGRLIFLKVNGLYRADSPDIFHKDNIVYDLEQELESSRKTYENELEKLQRTITTNLSLLEKKAKEDIPTYQLDGKSA